MNQSNVILKGFIKKFTNEDFFHDVINIALYPSNFNVTINSNDSSVDEYMQKFFIDLSQTVSRINIDNKKVVDTCIKTIKSILTIRNAGQGLLTYDSIWQHISPSNLAVQKLINNVIAKKIIDDETFRKSIDNTLANISYFYDLQTALSGMTKIHDFIEKSDSSDVSIIEMLTNYRDMGLEIHSDLNNLQSLNKDTATTDYYLLDGSDSANHIADEMVNYISNGYSFFKTGLEIFDNSIDGFESSSVHLITGPSNHGKSVMLANLFHSIVKHNIDEFNNNEAALFITLEDDIVKLLRKLICIFGNYEFNSVKDLYKKSYEVVKSHQKILQDSNEIIDIKINKPAYHTEIKKIFTNLINNSIISVTNDNFKIIIKHAPEDNFSPGDIGRQIEKLKMQGIIVKYVVIDYLDVMVPTISKSYYKMYDRLGQITQELRNLSNIYNMPVITATQNQREAENINIEMSNRLMGDSVLKVRYSDYITNIRMREDKTPFDDEVKQYIFKDGPIKLDENDPLIVRMKDEIIKDFIPMEVKITKAKETGKGTKRYVLFCKKNVRIYNYLDDYLNDIQCLIKNTRQLESSIRSLTNTSQLSIGTETFEYNM